MDLAFYHWDQSDTMTHLRNIMLNIVIDLMDYFDKIYVNGSYRQMDNPNDNQGMPTKKLSTTISPDQ